MASRPTDVLVPVSDWHRIFPARRLVGRETLSDGRRLSGRMDDVSMVIRSFKAKYCDILNHEQCCLSDKDIKAHRDKLLFQDILSLFP